MTSATETRMLALLPQGDVGASADGPTVLVLLGGDPAPRVWNLDTDAIRQFHAGQWAATAGRWRVVRATHEPEHCVLRAGTVRLTDRNGATQTFHAGGAFVVSGGFEGVWENIGAVRKHCAILQSKEAPWACPAARKANSVVRSTKVIQ